MAQRVRVELNHPGMADLLLAAGVQREVGRRAEQVLAAARGSAPVETGAYERGLHIEFHTTDRVTARVCTGVAYGIEVEAATGNLARALSAGTGA